MSETAPTPAALPHPARLVAVADLTIVLEREQQALEALEPWLQEQENLAQNVMLELGRRRNRKLAQEELVNAARQRVCEATCTLYPDLRPRQMATLHPMMAQMRDQGSPPPFGGDPTADPMAAGRPPRFDPQTRALWMSFLGWLISPAQQQTEAPASVHEENANTAAPPDPPPPDDAVHVQTAAAPPGPNVVEGNPLDPNLPPGRDFPIPLTQPGTPE